MSNNTKLPTPGSSPDIKPSKLPNKIGCISKITSKSGYR